MAKLFGTDGIRGTPGEYPLTEAIIFKIGKACANISYRLNGATNLHHTIIIGKDTRLSGEKIEKILANGIASCGVNVLLAGIIPTPGLAFLTRHFKADIGIMISASHNQAKDNGVKFFSKAGYKLSLKNEELIEKLIFSNIVELDALPVNQPGLVSQVKDSQKLYIDFLKSSAKDLELKGLKIVIDCAYGAFSRIAPVIFKELGAEVYSTNDQPNGANINLSCGALYPENMAKLVTRYKADIGFAYDGDGDRVILSDEKGNILDGDYIMAIIGLHLLKRDKLPRNTLVTTVMSNYGLQEVVENAGGRLIQTEVGDRYVTEELLKSNLILGGEQSGHIVFLNQSTTGDAMITCLEILKVIKEAKNELSQLAQCMRKYPQVLINVKVKEKKPFEHIPEVQERISLSNSRLTGNGRLLVRYSGTEPVARIMVEGRDEDLITDIAHSLAEQIRQEIGY